MYINVNVHKCIYVFLCIYYIAVYQCRKAYHKQINTIHRKRKKSKQNTSKTLTVMMTKYKKLVTNFANKRQFKTKLFFDKLLHSMCRNCNDRDVIQKA